MYFIENELFKVEINETGGAMASIYDKVNRTSLMYSKDERSWQGTDVVIFPFIAALKDKKYLVNGKEYSLKNHGIIRYEKVSVKENLGNKLILEFNSSEKTIKDLYPFKFHFEVCYELNSNELNISYLIKNSDCCDMYFSVGGHPAIKTSGFETKEGFEFENTKLIFNDFIKTKRFILNEAGNLITGCEDVVLDKEINLNKKMITDSKTLIYDAKDIKNVTLLTNGYSFTFDVSKALVLAIWTWPGFGDYVCVEPWWGIPDYDNPKLELRDKPYIQSLKSGCVFNTGYSIKINKINFYL